MAYTSYDTRSEIYWLGKFCTYNFDNCFKSSMYVWLLDKSIALKL